MTSLDMTSPKRRSRMHRASTGKRLELTKRDLEIFKLLARYRYLRSTYIHAFVGGNKTKLIERLGNLYHEGGYLDRPVQQWEAANARYMPVVYELGLAGAEILDRNGIGGVSALRNRKGSGLRYRHELMVCDLLASIELDAHGNPNTRFIPWEEILESPKMPEATRASLNPRGIPVSLGPNVSISENAERLLVPDAIFGIEYGGEGGKSYRFFALEADRNTEPVTRRDLRQSSFLRKLFQYQEVGARSLFRNRWGLPNLLVLTVTTSEPHLENICQAVSETLPAGAGTNLLFRAMPEVFSLDGASMPSATILAGPWKRPSLPPIAL